MTDITAIEPGMVRRGPVAVTPPPQAARNIRLATQWLGVAPFFLFVVMFLILPTAYLMVGAFQDDSGAFTFDNVISIVDPPSMAAYSTANTPPGPQGRTRPASYRPYRPPT